MSIGFFSWTVRGTRGYGGSAGSTYAALLWAIIWYFLSINRRKLTNNYSNNNINKKTSNYGRYSLGWAVFGITVGIGFNGMRGWMQYQFWRQGIFYLEGPPAWTGDIGVNPIYGYIWWIICAMPWAGFGALIMSWSGSKERYDIKKWCVRFLFGGVGALIAFLLWLGLPGLFLPNYSTGLYDNLDTCYGCYEAVGDTRGAIVFFGSFLGFLLFEIIQKDWMNVKLILIVSLISAGTWVFFQAINVQSLGWRYFEGFAGLGFGLAYGIGYFVSNRPNKFERKADDNDDRRPVNPNDVYPNAEKGIGIHLVLILVIAWSSAQSIHQMFENILPEEPPKIFALIPALVAGLTFIFISFSKIKRNPMQNYTYTQRQKDFKILFFVSYAILKTEGILLTITACYGISSEAVLDNIITLTIYILTTLLEILLLYLYMRRSKR